MCAGARYGTITNDPGKAHTIQSMIGRSIPNTNSTNPMVPQMTAISSALKAASPTKASNSAGAYKSPRARANTVIGSARVRVVW
jgi:hypothetical protein